MTTKRGLPVCSATWMRVLARRYPFLLVRAAWADEPASLTAMRLFGADRGGVRLVARHRSWSLWDTSGIPER